MTSRLLRVCILAVGLCLFAAGSLAETGTAEHPASGATTHHDAVSIAVGPYDSRNVNSLAALLQNQNSDHSPQFNIIPVIDSVSALEHLRSKDADIAIVPSDTAWAAYNALAPFIGKPEFHDIRVAGILNEESLALITRQLRGLRRVHQLQQYRIGLVGQVYDIFDYILEANKMVSTDLDSIKPVEPLAGADALCDGSADLVVMFAGDNDPVVREMYNRCPAMFMPLDDDTLNTLLERFSYLSRSSFQTHWYVPTAYVFQTLGRGIMILARKDTPDAVVKTIDQLIGRIGEAGGNARWLLSARNVRDHQKSYGLPVHESLVSSHSDASGAQEKPKDQQKQ